MSRFHLFTKRYKVSEEDWDEIFDTILEMEIMALKVMAANRPKAGK